jgi:hypothetical protein
MTFTLAAACGEAAPGDVTTADSAEVAIITSGSVDHALPWALTEELRIGGADSGAGSFTAASPSLVQTDGHNRIVVLDRERNAVEVYDSAGVLTAQFGARGGGPGEFGFAIELLDLGPDQVGVYDHAKAAIVRWSADGAVLPELRVIPATRVMRGDTAWLATMEIATLRSMSGVARAVATDTIALDSLAGPPRKMTEFSCFAAMLPPMFTGRMVWAFSEGRVAAIRQSDYAVQVFEGPRLVRSIRRSIAPVPTSADMAEREYPDGWTVSFGGDGECTLEPAEVAGKLGMASHLPVITGVVFGPRGTLWVERHAFPGEPAVTDVFDQAGAYLGTVHGKGLPLGWLGEDRVLFAIENDETGVSVIGLFRISEGASSS